MAHEEQYVPIFSSSCDSIRKKPKLRKTPEPLRRDMTSRRRSMINLLLSLNSNLGKAFPNAINSRNSPKACARLAIYRYAFPNFAELIMQQREISEKEVECKHLKITLNDLKKAHPNGLGRGQEGDMTPYQGLPSLEAKLKRDAQHVDDSSKAWSLFYAH